DTVRRSSPGPVASPTTVTKSPASARSRPLRVKYCADHSAGTRSASPASAAGSVPAGTRTVTTRSTSVPRRATVSRQPVVTSYCPTSTGVPARSRSVSTARSRACRPVARSLCARTVAGPEADAHTARASTISAHPPTRPIASQRRRLPAATPSRPVRGSGTVLAQVGDLGRGHPTLVDAELELLQAERARHRSLAAGVLQPQPVVVLGQHDERLPPPHAHRADVRQALQLGQRHHPDVAALPDLGEAVRLGGPVQPHRVAVRAGLVVHAAPAGQVTVAQQDSSARRHESPTATNRWSPSRLRRHSSAPCGNRILSTLNSAITSPLSAGANPLPRNGARSITQPCIAAIAASVRPP